MIRVLISGRLYGAPESRTGKSGKSFVTCKLRVDTGEESPAWAIAHALGDYAKTFSSDVLLEAKFDRHPTDLAQFMGARLGLTSEPASDATWNDARVKHLTGDAKISARFMRADFFEFQRTQSRRRIEVFEARAK